MSERPPTNTNVEDTATLSPEISILENGDIVVSITSRGLTAQEWIDSLKNKLDIDPDAAEYLLDPTYEPYDKGKEIKIQLIDSSRSYHDMTEIDDSVNEFVDRKYGKDKSNEISVSLNDEAVFLLAATLRPEDFDILYIDYLFVYSLGFEPHRPSEEDEEYDGVQYNPNEMVMFCLRLDENREIDIQAFGSRTQPFYDDPSTKIAIAYIA